MKDISPKIRVRCKRDGVQRRQRNKRRDKSSVEGKDALFFYNKATHGKYIVIRLHSLHSRLYGIQGEPNDGTHNSRRKPFIIK